MIRWPFTCLLFVLFAAGLSACTSFAQMPPSSVTFKQAQKMMQSKPSQPTLGLAK